jgi:hypothetical protein
MIENLKDGNYNNYVGNSSKGSPNNETSKPIVIGDSRHENQSVISRVNHSTIKAKR